MKIFRALPALICASYLALYADSDETQRGLSDNGTQVSVDLLSLGY